MRTLALYRRFFTQIRQPTPRAQKRFQTHEMSSIPQIRAVPESEAEGPVFKKQRLEGNGSDTGASLEKAIRVDVEEEKPQHDAPGRMDSSGAGASLVSKVKKSKKKRKDPPLPEPCSGADVLYQEVRTLLGERVVDRITEEGGAFKSPYSYGDEITLKIDAFGSGGASFWPLKLLVYSILCFERFWNCCRQGSMGNCCPLRPHGRNCAG